MNMKIMDVPFKSISDVKRAPMGVFNEARESRNGVYILNNNKAVGVALTPEQYESMSKEIESLYDRIDELTVKARLAEPNIKTYTEEEVLGNRLDDVTYDENDGWE